MFSEQGSLFDALHAPPVVVKVDPDGPVVKEPHEVLIFYPRGERVLWAYGEIELHPHENGLWMWSASYGVSDVGSCYRVGPKWGRFAETRAAAVFYGARELLERLQHHPDDADAQKIAAWAKGLQ